MTKSNQQLMCGFVGRESGKRVTCLKLAYSFTPNTPPPPPPRSLLFFCALLQGKQQQQSAYLFPHTPLVHQIPTRSSSSYQTGVCHTKSTTETAFETVAASVEDIKPLIISTDNHPRNHFVLGFVTVITRCFSNLCSPFPSFCAQEGRKRHFFLLRIKIRIYPQFFLWLDGGEKK